jgi:hypothetical protein
MPRTLLPSIFVTAFGFAWLISALGIIPQVNWIWTIGLGVVGLSTIAYQGINKLSVIVGPGFVAASLFSILRQMEYVTIEIEVPMLVILAGILMIIAHLQSIPKPTWLFPNERECSNA